MLYKQSSFYCLSIIHFFYFMCSNIQPHSKVQFSYYNKLDNLGHLGHSLSLIYGKIGEVVELNVFFQTNSVP